MSLITTPGFYPHITPDQYFAEPCPEPALTNSGITMLLKTCPAKFAHEHPAIDQPPEERAETAASHMGSLVHRLALEKGDDYAVSPYDEYRTNEAKAWKKATEEAGLIPVKKAVMDDALEMAAVIKGAIDAELRGAEYQTEVVIAWQRRGRWCRAMIDVWCPSLLRALDVKTCAGADDLSVDRAFAQGYGRQEAWYSDGIDRLTGRSGKASFGFLFVEKTAPFLARYAQSSEAMSHGSAVECDRAFERFDLCMGDKQWPGYAPRIVQPTPWQVREWTEAEYEEAA